MTRTEQTLLPRDCRLHALETLPDRRGSLTEMFREAWFDSPPPRSWHVTRGRAEAHTGIRVYAQDWLYLCLVDGSMWVSLADLRAAPAEPVMTAQPILSDTLRQVLVIAPGVAHAIYFPQPARYLLGRAEAGEDPAEHLLCAWNSPDLDAAGLRIPAALPQTDQRGSSFAEFKAAFAAIWAGRDGVDRA